jgi:hypothetical protein
MRLPPFVSFAGCIFCFLGGGPRAFCKCASALFANTPPLVSRACVHIHMSTTNKTPMPFCRMCQAPIYIKLVLSAPSLPSSFLFAVSCFFLCVGYPPPLLPPPCPLTTPKPYPHRTHTQRNAPPLPLLPNALPLFWPCLNMCQPLSHLKTNIPFASLLACFASVNVLSKYLVGKLFHRGVYKINKGAWRGLVFERG